MERSVQVLIVGGGPGGRVSYMALRKMGIRSIAMVADEPPTVICSLPYGIGRRLIPGGPERVIVDLRESPRLPKEIADDTIWGRVVSVDHPSRLAVVRTGSGDVLVRYEKLILAQGAAPWIPQVPGVLASEGSKGPTVMVGDGLYHRDALANNVKVLRGAQDAIEIDKLAGDAKRSVVVGSGAIGLEVAEALVDRGLQVTLVEVLDHVVAALDLELAAVVENKLLQRGVDVRLGVTVKEVRQGEVILSDGSSVPMDFVVFASGVRPRLDLARSLGLKVERGVVVDQAMRASFEGVYAVGDMAQVQDAATGRPMLPLIGTLAMRQAMVAAMDIAGMPAGLPPVTVWGVSQIFDLHWGSVGWTLEAARRAGMPAESVAVPIRSRDPFMEGRDGMWRITVAMGGEGLKPGQIIGFQVATEGDNPIHLAERFIDIITARSTVQDLFARYFIHSPSHNAVDDPYLGLMMEAQKLMAGPGGQPPAKA
ncbi:NAD(P)H-nitrite reductase [Thermanaerovibrio velox DSM 12556]|uniref:NAD(P)H-nitrite reductase n=1 Tax=Thermanaerovibrio velox DSM 12556 TaxID=926567 RepID=H0UQR5_9BACT|nr:NAD(P)/FAD-dependent oxidoreductase [Thermanaerovibrio velox]EHM10830.1 NAD(P)H-nitrite reductase [Thermanaerovibrio velox DSM 12556]